MKDCLKQVFKLTNPSKYFGTKNPICKSSWEYQVFNFMDKHPDVTRWGYECLEVPYFNPLKGGYTIYYPDIYCHTRQANGSVKQFLIEIKPNKMCSPPVQPAIPKTKTPNSLKKYEKALRRYTIDKGSYEVNKSKWEQALAWCNRHGITFLLVTEKEVPTFTIR